MTFKTGLVLALIIGGCTHLSVSSITGDTSNKALFNTVHTKAAVALPNWPEFWDITTRYLFDTQVDQRPANPIAVHKLTLQELDALPTGQISVIRFGHSTVLIKIDGEYWLTDPVFSDSLGPIYSLGIERFHELPISIEELPNIQGVVISHNHYDHFDKQTIEALRAKVQYFLVPIGNGQTLLDWGVSADKITELDWWQSKKIGNLTISATPANHLSGRVLFDQNDALWSSWVFSTTTHNIFFSGDSGYSEIFKTIGDKFGPFDLTIMENGSYYKGWAKEHLSPEETIQAHLDLKGKHLLPVHNSTFDMAFHPWYEPLTKINILAENLGISLETPAFGEPFTLQVDKQHTELKSKKNRNWWTQNDKNQIERLKTKKGL